MRCPVKGKIEQLRRLDSGVQEECSLNQRGSVEVDKWIRWRFKLDTSLEIMVRDKKECRWPVLSNYLPWKNPFLPFSLLVIMTHWWN